MATPDSRGQGNPVTDWHVGEPKTPTYDSFRVVDSRRISREAIDEAQLCAVRVRWNRNDRALIAAYLSTVDRDNMSGSPGPWRWSPKKIRLCDLFNAEEAKEAPTLDTTLPSWPVVPDGAKFTTVYEVQLEGEAAAAALGLDDEWRAMLGMPPLSDNDAAV